MEKIDNLETFNLIENINNKIYVCCIDGLYDKQSVKYELYQKIRNMTLELQINAHRLILGKSLRFESEISLDQIKEMLIKTYTIVATQSFDTIEASIKKLISEYSIDLDELWFENLPDDFEQYRLQSILHGIR